MRGLYWTTRNEQLLYSTCVVSPKTKFNRNKFCTLGYTRFNKWDETSKQCHDLFHGVYNKGKGKVKCTLVQALR